MNPNGVEIVRVYTKETGAFNPVPDYTPHVPSGGGSFDVVVEAEAGDTLLKGGAPYKINIVAFDYTTGNSAPPPVFSSSHTGNFNKSPWTTGDHQEVFTITVPGVIANTMQDHILKYLAYLVTPDAGPPLTISFAESPLFILSGE